MQNTATQHQDGRAAGWGEDFFSGSRDAHWRRTALPSSSRDPVPAARLWVNFVKQPFELSGVNRRYTAAGWSATRM